MDNIIYNRDRILGELTQLRYQTLNLRLCYDGLANKTGPKAKDRRRRLQAAAIKIENQVDFLINLYRGIRDGR